MDLKKYKCNLVERLGVFLEQEEQLAPLAARILAILLLTDKNGITFEQLVGDLRASKSTISTHLQSLLNNGRINYFTKQGDRKRYFTINPNRILKSIDDMMEKWQFQKQIHLDMIYYKEKCNELENTAKEPAFNLETHQNYLTFLEEASASILKLKEKIIIKINKS